VLQHRGGLGDAAAELARIHDMIDDCLVEVRRISRDLRPSILEDLGLEAAIAAYVADIRRSTETAIGFHPSGRAIHLQPAHELALYRFAQEAVANAVRHADARRIDIDLRWGDEVVEIEVVDDGRGFAPPDTLAGLMRHGSLGLAGLADRIGEIGGALAIVSAPRQGTRLRARLPIRLGYNAAP
jgi:signal transduction histidine kinase